MELLEQVKADLDNNQDNEKLKRKISNLELRCNHLVNLCRNYEAYIERLEKHISSVQKKTLVRI